MEDYEIVNLYWERNETAISATEKKYGAYCFSIAKNILHLEQDAEECINDMYNRAWNSIPPYRPEKLGAWLGKVIRNIAINLWNKNHAQKRYSGMEELFYELEDCIPSPKLVEHEIEEKELTDLLNSWLASLSEEDRILFMRRYWNGEALKTLEKEYDISHGKIAKRMYCLRINLKNVLEKEGYCL
ncbi:MAG: sigma-70 family RNA polymerase sigma factor [Tyzzerella sp.]|nr:sigma-70 family RNA polymerase sigma factor [Tyzzerella sp.]